MRSKPIVVALDWDDWIAGYCAVRQCVDVQIDLHEFRDSSRIWASSKTINLVNKRLAGSSNDHPRITLLGSGDYHHITLLLLGQLARADRPISIVLFDNHPDWFSHRPRYHCGNWLWSAARLRGVSDVTIIGPSSSDLAWHRFYFAPRREIRTGRITLLPVKLERIRVWGFGEFRFQSIRSTPHAIENVINSLKGRDVYISVDKDCLRETDATTDWEAGEMALSEVTGALELLASTTHLVGGDITGERSPAPVRGFLRKLDSGRWHVRSRPTAHETAANEAATLALLRAMGIELQKGMA